MKKDSLNELLYQMLETEMGGVQVYTTAIRCAQNADLKKEWKKYLEQTKNHVKVVRGIFDQVGLDPEADTPGRDVVRHIAWPSGWSDFGVSGAGSRVGHAAGSTGASRRTPSRRPGSTSHANAFDS